MEKGESSSELCSLVCQESDWVIDSSASFHVTPHGDFFTYSTGDFGNVKMENIGASKIVGIGDICLETNLGSKLVLKDVRHVPDIRLNLISTGRLDDEGFTSYFGESKSTLACALSQGLHMRGKLSYVLDGDNVRHGLNSDLSFKAKDRAENIRRIGEVAKLFADAGIICIASLISPYRSDRGACRSLLPEGDFIEVYLDVPLEVCESRDPKGLYKLARAGKIKGFTGIDDPYEPPLNCEIVLQQKGKDVVPLCKMTETVISYLGENGYLQA
ncbi:Adenylyl-sulfate kinase [Morus notabilis]|uniref:Adenylyl-sulfate kinase n=1 Tax=Morus notabilis TaxID=981085 RepID=W9RIY4_9ROSA|nr:Adenylyl-sulfate kinase [Morus notabilis]